MNVDLALKQLNANRSDFIAKGNYGEVAAIYVIQKYMEINQSVLFHSYSYEYVQRRDGTYYPGNIKYENEEFVAYEGRDGIKDEIDILYITPRKIFVIECKARSGKWNLFDHWSSQQRKRVDKCPVAQSEKHARHLYHHIYEMIPEGDPSYIQPLVVFVDKSTINDTRSEDFRNYIPIAILNNLKKTIAKLDVEGKYTLDVDYIVDYLKRNGEYTKIY